MKRCPSCHTAFPSDYTLCPRDGSSLITIGEWAEGTLVRGKYRILAKVGQGGMGSVYKVMHVRFKEIRAIKVIGPELAGDANFIRRFEQEAIITRKLQHPNAVRVEDIDEAEDGRPFIVMEYIEGRSLKEVIDQEAPIDVSRVCAIVKQAAAALDAAHSLGLVHRDIKPANIALIRSSNKSGAPAEEVKILDFGIAKLKEIHLQDSKASHLSHLTLTDTGVVIGTPAYMSPEQARGTKGDQLDGRSDIYSLGVVMYQMLTGQLPLKADSTIEQLMAHINIQPKPIRVLRPDVSEHVAAIVMRCLEKKREARPLSGQVLVDLLSDASSRLPTPSPSVAADQPLLRAEHRQTILLQRRAVRVIASVVTLAGVSSTAFTNIFDRPLRLLFSGGYSVFDLAFYRPIGSLAPIFAAVGALVAALAMRRYVPRMVATIFVVLYCAGFGITMASFLRMNSTNSNDLEEFAICSFFILGGIGAGGCSAVALTTLINWFPIRPGLACGLCAAVYTASVLAAG